MSLGMHPQCLETCPRTPDRVAPVTQSMSLEHLEDEGIAAVSNLSSRLSFRCDTPSRQMPMMSPPSARMPMKSPTSGKPPSGASHATSVRGVATPLRASRRYASTAAQEELDAPTPRALKLCDCGHCSTCAVASTTIHGIQEISVIASSAGTVSDRIFAECKMLKLSDLACPRPSSPGQSPLDFAILAGMPDLELVKEVPIRGALRGSAHALREAFFPDPRRQQQQQVLSPLLIIPVSTSNTEASVGKASDPRIRPFPSASKEDARSEAVLVPGTSLPRQGGVLLPSSRDPRRKCRRLAKELGCYKTLLHTATPCKRRLSPSSVLAPPLCPSSLSNSASCRARRYRSPTPGPEEVRPSSKGARYRSPTPEPSRCKRSDSAGYAHSTAIGATPRVFTEVNK